MSAPDPKAWMPEPWEVSEVAMQSDSEFGDNDESGIVSLCESVARRRALAELRALLVFDFEVEEGCPGWRAVNVDEIHARIAAIEAEEATPASASE